MNDDRESKKWTFSIRGLLIITALVALHFGVPILGRALLATIVAAIILGLISAYPLAAVVAIWHFITGGNVKEAIKSPKWIGHFYMAILALVYVVVAIVGLIAMGLTTTKPRKNSNKNDKLRLEQLESISIPTQ